LIEEASQTWVAFFIWGLFDGYLIVLWYVDMAYREIIEFWGVSTIRLFDGYLIGEMAIL